MTDDSRSDTARHNPYAKSYNAADAPGWRTADEAVASSHPTEGPTSVASAPPATPQAPAPEPAPAPAPEPAPAPAPAPVAAPMPPIVQAEPRAVAAPGGTGETNPYAKQYNPLAAGAPSNPLPAPAASAPPAPAFSPVPAAAPIGAGPRKRKVWPWVLTGVLVVLVAAVAAVALLWPQIRDSIAGGMTNAGYTGAPVESGDAAQAGGTVVVSGDERVAFEVAPQWVDAANYVDVAALASELPSEAEMLGLYMTGDPVSNPDVSLVLVTEGTPVGIITSSTLSVAHAGYVNGLRGSLEAQAESLSVGEATQVVTPQGLAGYRTDIDIDISLQGTHGVLSSLTFGNGDKVAFVQVSSYTGQADEATIAALLAGLRIDQQ